MNIHGEVIVAIIGVFFGVVTLELVRRKHLRPEYALLWACVSLVTLVLAFCPPVIELLQKVMGMDYRSCVIVLVFMFTAVMMMNYSIIASRHSSRIVRMTQEITLLRLELERLRKQERADCATPQTLPKEKTLEDS